MKDLVSIVILAYNSERFIKETLQSCLSQSYDNLEIIISDDASKDSTWSIIKKWKLDYDKNFHNIVINRNEMNLGVSANCNKAVSKATGKWIKIIAADDILEETCISTFVHATEEHGELWYQSGMYQITENSEFVGERIGEKEYLEQLGNMTCIEQYRAILKRDVKVTPTMFYSKAIYDEVGGADERIPMIEDWGLKLRFLKHGYRMGVVKKNTVLYRVGNSISNTTEEVFNLRHIENKQALKKLLIYPNISKCDIRYWCKEFRGNLQIYIIVHLFHNRRNKWTYSIRRILK